MRLAQLIMAILCDCPINHAHPMRLAQLIMAILCDWPN